MSQPTPLLVKRALLLFWALYFTIVFASNLADAFQAMALLPEGFPFVSGNYALIVRVTGIYGTPDEINVTLFLGLLLWQALAVGLFWRAFRSYGRRADGWEAVYRSFGTGIGLWASFVLMDEVFIAYEIPGLEATHLRLFVASIVSLLAMHLLPDALVQRPPR